jgi:hypothetical protein
MAPVALTSTPPRPAWVVTPGLEPAWPACSAGVSEAAVLTPITASTPGFVSVVAAAPGEELPPGSSGVMAALPDADEPGTAVTATPPFVGAADPGAAQTR